MITFDPSEEVWLVYVQSTRGPSPQKVSGDQSRPHLICERHVIAKTRLAADDRGKSFAELVALYPPPKSEEP